MKKIIHRGETRGEIDYGWLLARYSFSFANYLHPERAGFGILRVLNDDVIQGGMGLSNHSHQNMEIVTLPLYGLLEHKDNNGGKFIIKAGDAQMMSAGTGITHSEWNGSPTEETNFLQIWILPNKLDLKPLYQQKSFFVEKRKNSLQLLASPDYSPTTLLIHQNAYVSMGKFDGGKNLSYDLHGTAQGVYLFIIEGRARCENEHLGSRDAIGIWETEKILVHMENSGKLLLIEVPMEQTQ